MNLHKWVNKGKWFVRQQMYKFNRSQYSPYNSFDKIFKEPESASQQAIGILSLRSLQLKLLICEILLRLLIDFFKANRLWLHHVPAAGRKFICFYWLLTISVPVLLFYFGLPGLSASTQPGYLRPVAARKLTYRNTEALTVKSHHLTLLLHVAHHPTTASCCLAGNDFSPA
jgi:hypothetical protein